MTEITESYRRAMNKPMPSLPATVGRLLIRMNAASRDMLVPFCIKLMQNYSAAANEIYFCCSVREIERHHEVRANGQYATFDSEVQLARSVCKIQTYYEWKLKSRADEEGLGKWNRVSLGKLFTGRA